MHYIPAKPTTLADLERDYTRHIHNALDCEALGLTAVADWNWDHAWLTAEAIHGSTKNLSHAKLLSLA